MGPKRMKLRGAQSSIVVKGATRRKKANRPNRDGARTIVASESSDDSDSDNDSEYSDSSKTRRRQTVWDEVSENEVAEKLTLTDLPIRESYMLYNEILQIDECIKHWSTNPLIDNIFLDYNPEDVQVDDDQLERMKNRFPDEIRKAREMMQEKCLFDIFGDEQDVETYQGRFMYRALSKFNELPTRLEQEAVLFTIVAGTLLRSVVGNNKTLEREQITEPFEASENVWNLTSSKDDLQSPHTVPLPVIFAAYLWVASDPHVFMDGVTDRYLTLPEPPNFSNWKRYLKPWESGEVRVNVKNLCRLRVAPRNNMDWITNRGLFTGDSSQEVRKRYIR
jgi:hypothetical protein